jgi:hypothetical protein
MRVMSEIAAYTASGEAAMSRETSITSGMSNASQLHDHAVGSTGRQGVVGDAGVDGVSEAVDVAGAVAEIVELADDGRVVFNVHGAKSARPSASSSGRRRHPATT